MIQFATGNFLGEKTYEIKRDGLLLSKCNYHENLSSSWHYHENLYLSFILNGGCVERRQTVTNEYDTGKFVFYNKGEKHSNTNYQRGSGIFNVEISDEWLQKHDVEFSDHSIICINDPSLKMLVVQVLKEYAKN